MKSFANKKFKHDVIVIRGGLAGLTAAFTLAKRGIDVLLIERKSNPETLDHPCGAMVAPIRNAITFGKEKEGIYFKELDFLFTNQMILSPPRLMYFESPNGANFKMEISDDSKSELISSDLCHTKKFDF